MKRLFTVLTTATFFAISCSLIDQFIWKNDFSLINLCIGFSTGAALVLLSNPARRLDSTQ